MMLLDFCDNINVQHRQVFVNQERHPSMLQRFVCTSLSKSSVLVLACLTLGVSVKVAQPGVQKPGSQWTLWNASSSSGEGTANRPAPLCNGCATACGSFPK